MKYMHTKLPDFYTKVQDAGKADRPDTEVEVRGLESYTSGKMASLRVGRIEEYIREITTDENVKKVEVVFVPHNPEAIFTAVIKGIQADGTCKKAILEEMALSVPTEECELFGVEEIVDRRGSGRQQR